MLFQGGGGWGGMGEAGITYFNKHFGEGKGA